MIIETYSNEGDIVLDSFGGSGSTAATAHKLNRKWVTVEMEDHAETHILQRLTNVVNGDKTGISESVNCKGGGGFQFCELSEPLLDEFGLLYDKVSFKMLAKHIYFTEFGTALETSAINENKHFAGTFKNTGLFIYIEDNFSLSELNKLLESKFEKYIVFVDTWSISEELLDKNNITIKRLPLDIKGV